MIRNNQNRRRRGGNGPRPQQMAGGNNYGNRLDNRQRGNASQLLEKYRALARDAQQAGDRVTAEYYLQYAEHYYRVLGDYRDKAPDQNRQRGRDFYEEDGNGFGDDADAGDDDRGEARGEVREVRDDDREPRDDDTRSDDTRSDDSRSWQGERPRERNRDGNRSEIRPDNRDRQERQPWAANRNANDGQRPDRGEPRAERSEPRAERNESRRDRPEPRRPEYRDAPRAETRAPLDVVRDESPIPGLPGPATLRINRNPDPAPVAAPETPAEAAADAPKRRGRPRKVVAELPIDG